MRLLEISVLEMHDAMQQRRDPSFLEEGIP